MQAQGSTPPSTSPGCHLSSPGSYCNSIVRLTGKYPNLKYPDYKKYNIPNRKVAQTRSAVIRFQGNNSAEVIPFFKLDQLVQYLDDVVAPPGLSPLRELFLLEGINQDFVSVLGSALEADPNIFMRHQRNGLWESAHRAGCTPPLPSLANPTTSFMLQYRELSYFPIPFDEYQLRTADNERNIRVTSLNGKFEKVGAVHRKASFWARSTRNGGWKAIMIVDEPVNDILVGRERDARRKASTNEPFQGGYADFIPYNNLKEALQNDGPPRKSMFDDLCYYFSHHSNQMMLTDQPSSAAIFLKKIIASHYMMLYRYTEGMLDHLTWFLGNQQNYAGVDVNALAADLWSDLHAFNRRCQYDLNEVSSIVTDLDLNLASGDASAKDFLTLQRDFTRLKTKAEALIASCNTLANVVGIKQSLREARNVTRVTILGAFFLPLSLTTGLFSMAPQYLPGAPGFWIYFAIAIPIVLMVFILSFRDPFLVWLRPLPERLKHRILGEPIDIWATESRYGTSSQLQMLQGNVQYPAHEMF